MSTQTPWGKSQSKRKIASGIIFYSTASHGGFHLSPKRLKQMPFYLRNFRGFCGKEGWYEEDCDYNIVICAFPQYFTKEDLERAQAQVFKSNNPYFQSIRTAKEEYVANFKRYVEKMCRS